MRPKTKISYEELMDLIPEELLTTLAQDTGVDKSVKKLTGRVMLSLFLYGCTSGKQMSLRMLEDMFHTPTFQIYSKGSKIRHSGIAERLKTMNVEYVKKIFEHLTENEKVDRWLGIVGKRYVVRKIDSTIVTLTAKLLKVGMDINKGTRNIKYGTDLVQGLPTHIQLFTKQTYASEDKALPEIINQKSLKNKDQTEIMVFDRGMQSRDTLERIAQTKNTEFVTRLTFQGYKVDEVYKKVKGRPAGSLVLVSDEKIHFESQKEQRDVPLRLITAYDQRNHQKYQFLTSIFFLNAPQICQLYKERWEIETFYKFLKQQMSFSHLISRSEDGIQIVMYLTMIAAILIALYKKINKISSWFGAQVRFVGEMESYILRTFAPELRSMWGLPTQKPTVFNTS